MRKHGAFEWLADPSVLCPLLYDKLPILKGCRRALVLGCGTSELSAVLWSSRRVESVVSIDRDQDNIELMRMRYPMLEWRAASFEDYEETSEFCIALDKSTLDATLAEVGHVAGLVDCARRCLGKGGYYLVISLYPVDLVASLVASFDLVSSMRHETISIVLFRKGVMAAPERGEEIERQKAVLDNWFREKNPMLTPQRAAKLRTSWTNFRDEENSVDVDKAYQLIFTRSERSVYEVEDFRDDLALFFSLHGNKQSAPSSLRLDEAFAFVAAFQ